MFGQATSTFGIATGTGVALATNTVELAKTFASNPTWQKLASFAVIDVVLGILLIGFIVYGLYFGLIRTLGSLLGIVVGAFVASHFYLIVSEWIQTLFFGYENLGKVLVFIIIFFIVNRLVCFLFMLVDRAFDILSIIPFLKSINHLAGAVFGFIEGALVLGLIIYVTSRYTLLDSWFGGLLATSKIAPYLSNFAKILLPLLPEALKKAQSLIK
jgi:uncharacterized membrane protein required for colicin V production